MSNPTQTLRAAKIQAILDARRPMAERASKYSEKLYEVESTLQSFKAFIPGYAVRLDPQVASAVSILPSEIDAILSRVAEEKARVTQLEARFSRRTLNIGVAGRAGQGKSTFLQKLTGLSSNEIPSGDKGHCTGAPSIIANQEVPEAHALIELHNQQGFFECAITPFYEHLEIHPKPDSLTGFADLPDPQLPKHRTHSKASDEEHLKRLVFRKKHLSEYRPLLNGETRRITRAEIRHFVAQEDTEGRVKFTNWLAVKLATIYCRFPHADLGAIAVADTPGLGDFIAGAEDRLVATVGRSLDCVITLRRPPADRAVIEPADIALHDLLGRAIPDLPVSDWSYFVINRDPANEANLDFFGKQLEESEIRTRRAVRVDCTSEESVARGIDVILTDIASNLGSLDRRLLDRAEESLRSLATNIRLFAERAASILPKASVAAPDIALLQGLFGTTWQNLGVRLTEIAREYRAGREEIDEAFAAEIDSCFQNLDLSRALPSPEEISRESAASGLQKWHADKMHDLRVRLTREFDRFDEVLGEAFDILRAKLAEAMNRDDGGRLDRITANEPVDFWNRLIRLLADHDGSQPFLHTIERLLSATLSFRGLIRPRIRQHLDVLDDASEKAADYSFTPGDSADIVRDKLQCAWENAVYECKKQIERITSEPSMARFAACEDFVDGILHSGGEETAKGVWFRFYYANRAEIWPGDFEKLEANSRLRGEWESKIKQLNATAQSLVGSDQ